MGTFRTRLGVWSCISTSPHPHLSSLFSMFSALPCPSARTQIQMMAAPRKEAGTRVPSFVPHLVLAPSQVHFLLALSVPSSLCTCLHLRKSLDSVLGPTCHQINVRLLILTLVLHCCKCRQTKAAWQLPVASGWLCARQGMVSSMVFGR